MASTDYLLSILAVFKDAATGELKKFSGGLGNLDKQSKKSKKSIGDVGSSISGLATGLIAGTVAIAGAGVALKKAFDLGKEGAAIQQTEDSFIRLLDQIDAAPNLLRQLRRASGNTVSDLKLMSATTTLLAGTQGELATALAQATPQLLEIAKAANILNPTLGDTTFLYQSLATGIKRASPLMIDNTGVIVKIGQANKAYAESIGKTVEQLTAEEQKMALLNETMRAGKILIDQAGDAADSAVDDFARLEATIANAADAAKKQLAPALADLAEKAYDFLTFGADLKALANEEESAILDLGDTYREYVDNRLKKQAEMERKSPTLFGDTKFFITNLGTLAREFTKLEKLSNRGMDFLFPGVIPRTGGAGMEVLADFKMAPPEWEAVFAREELFQETVSLIRGQKELALVNDTTAYSVDGVAGSLRTLADDERAATLTAENLAFQQGLVNKELSLLALAMRGPVSGAYGEFAGTQLSLSQRTEEVRQELGLLEGQLLGMPRGGGVGQLTADLEGVVGQMGALGPEPKKLNRAREAAMRDLEWAHLNTAAALEEEEKAAGAYGATTAKVEALRAELLELEGQMSTLEVEHREATESMILDMAAQGGAAAELQWAIAEAFGEVDKKTLQVFAATEKVNKLYVDGKLTLEEAVGLYEELQAFAEKPVTPPPISEGAIGAVARFEEGGAFGRAYDVGQWMREQAGELPPGVQEMFDELERARLKSLPEEIETEITIVNEEELMKGMGYLDTVTKFLEGQHLIQFNIRTTGEFPSGDPGGPPDNSGKSKGDRQLGGPIPETGLYNLHAGEYVLPPMEAQQMASGGGGTTVTHGVTNNFNLNVTSTQEMTSLMQQFETMRAIAGA